MSTRHTTIILYVPRLKTQVHALHSSAASGSVPTYASAGRLQPCLPMVYTSDYTLSLHERTVKACSPAVGQGTVLHAQMLMLFL
jgi:hypothetical protein